MKGAGPRALLALLIAAAALLSPGCGRQEGKYEALPGRDGTVRVDLSGIGSGSGRFFSYRSSSGRPVDYFVYRDSTGAARAVLDACRTCYRWRKGYRLEGDHVVCIKCGMEFSLDGLAEGTGSCVPIRLSSRREGDTLVVPVAALEDGAKYF